MLQTINQLCRYLEEECYNFNSISIGPHYAQEGIVIEKNGNDYCFSYVERGKKEVVESFEKEEDLVKYALERLLVDEWYKAHLVAWVWNKDSILEAEKELKNKGIQFKRNDIPNFSQGKTAYRIFVFGKDVLKVNFLKQKYWKM